MNFSEKYVTFSTLPILKFTKYIFPLLYIVVFLLAPSINSEAAIGKKLPFIIITVDVETTHHDNGLITMPDQLDAICSGNIQCGLNEIVRLLRAKGYGATFFLDVYEYKKYGEPSLKKIAIWLNASGQDVELHTHPQWAYDQNRNMMYQYSLQEQVNIIKDGKEFLQKWTGRPVVAHRAGAYSADENTLKSLIANGIYYDSSLFYGWPDSKISSLELKKNALSLYGPLLEFPVTVYKRTEYPALLRTYLKPISRMRKYDINWFGNDEEAESAIREAIQLKMDFIILFLHSFSFIKGQSGAGQMIADGDAMKRFERILEFIRTQGMEVRTFKQIADTKAGWATSLGRQDVIPEISLRIPLIQYIRKLVGINKHNYKGVILYCGLFLASVALSVTIVKWRMTRSDRVTKRRR